MFSWVLSHAFLGMCKHGAPLRFETSHTHTQGVLFFTVVKYCIYPNRIYLMFTEADLLARLPSLIPA